MFNWKIKVRMFWDRKGILLYGFLPHGDIINVDVYCTTLERLWCAIQNCQQRLFTSGVSFLHHHTLQEKQQTTKFLENLWPLASQSWPGAFWLHILSKMDFHDERITKLVQHLDKCLNCNGDYVEK
jgi:hypothetical protein